MEKWKTYPLEFEFEEDYKIEISDFGRVKTYNVLQPLGKIINCSREQGYPVLKKTFHKKRSEKDALKLEKLDSEILVLQEKIKETKKNLNLSVEKRKTALLHLRKDRDALVLKRKNLNHKINKKRAIYFSLLIHKAVAELFLEKPKDNDKKFIIHKDFDKSNNHVNNLSWASQQEINERNKQYPKNIMHAFRKQFEPKVPNTKASKLNENEVLRIKLRLKKGDSLRKLALQFGVSDMQIHRIRTGENWSHVKLLEEILEEKK